MSPPDGEMGDGNVWRWVGDVGHGSHFVTWVALLELEKEGVHPINTSNVSERLSSMYETDVRPETAHNSMKRLVEKGALETTPLDVWHGGFHWSTTDEGREAAQTIAKRWQHVAGENCTND